MNPIFVCKFARPVLTLLTVLVLLLCSGSAWAISAPVSDSITEIETEMIRKENEVITLSAAEALNGEEWEKLRRLAQPFELVLNSISAVPDGALEYCENLVALTAPATTHIGKRAFGSCPNLRSVSLPKIESIGDEAFASCPSLTGIELPETLTVLGNAPFAKCTGLGSISVHAGNRTFKSVDDVLYNADETMLIFYPSGKSGASFESSTVKVVGTAAFFGNAFLRDISLPEAVAIGNDAFKASTLLKVVFLPKAETVGDEAFAFCTGLTSPLLPEAKVIGREAFASCVELKTELSLPKAEVIGSGAFSLCIHLREISLPEAKILGDRAFANCFKLILLSLPEKAPLLEGPNVFENVPESLSIRTPAGYTTIPQRIKTP